MQHVSLRTGLAVFVVAAALGGCVTDQQFYYNDSPSREIRTHAAPAPVIEAYTPPATRRALPALIVTDAPPPGVVYRRGSHDTVLASPDTGTAVRITPLSAQRMETVVTQKAADLEHTLDQVQDNTDNLSRRLQSLQNSSDAQLASYYALVASISADLQTGTTSGNPILVDRWNKAQDKMNAISKDTSLVNTLAMDLSDQASKAAFLMESTKAAFALSGAVDEDHRRLTAIEDRVNASIIATHRLMGQVNDALNRRATFLRTERANLQSLALSIGNGELHGQSLSNSVFKKASEGSVSSTARANRGSSLGAGSGHRPLVIIRFDRPNVNYDQPLYTAISQALEKYPAAKFDLVAVSSSKGNPAQIQMATGEARKNGEAVLRSLTQMGLPMERINLNAATSKEVLNSEVQLYLQ